MDFEYIKAQDRNAFTAFVVQLADALQPLGYTVSVALAPKISADQAGDVRSIQAKFNLIKEYQLRGAGYWQIMRWWRANWLLMNDNFFML